MFMKSILIVLSLFCFSSIYAQSDFDERLLVMFDESQITQFQQSDSPALDYWTFYLDNSYEIVDRPEGKNVGDIEELKIKNLEKFNILDSNLTMDRHAPKYYRIKGSDKMLVLLSGTEFTEKYNAYKLK